MDQNILHVLTYFNHFKYPPTVQELHLFLNSKIAFTKLEEMVKYLQKKRIIFRRDDRVSLDNNNFKYYELRRKRSIYYFKKTVQYLQWTRGIPFILFVGVSGSLSMLNMTENGDIDLFVITKRNSIWQARFVLLLYKYILKLINPDIGEKLCFNLFFSEDGLEIQKMKQNEYIGHEILQIKTVVNKNGIYDQFLEKNRWILKFFPNVQLNLFKKNLSKNLSKNSWFINFLENAFKTPQTWWLAKKDMKWFEKPGQLWLIQEDFEKKIL